MKSIMTSDGYVFFSSPMGWVDYFKPDGTPTRIDMWVSDETIEEWIGDGFAKVYEWSDEWTPLSEGPFDSWQEAQTYRDAEVARHMPTRFRPSIKDDGKLVWSIDCRLEATESLPCDICGVMVPFDEHCGETLPDSTDQYLCPDCYSRQRADRKYIHDWLIFTDGSHALDCGPIAIHKDVVDPNCIDAADCSSPDPDDHISRFGPGTSAHTLNSFADMHLDMNDVWLLVDDGFITWDGATQIFKTQGGE